MKTLRSEPRRARYWPAIGFQLGLAANLVVDVSGGRKVALNRAEPSMEAYAAGPIYLGIAAISSLSPTKAIMRLML